MIEPTNRIEQTLGIDLKKVYKSISAASIRKADSDQISISEFSALVEKTRALALQLPDIRPDKVRQAKADLANGKAPSSEEVASAMIRSTTDIRECKQ